MVVGRRVAKATAVVKVAGLVVVLAEEARAEARAEARVARVARVARAAAARLRRHLSPEGAQRTCGLQGSAFGRVLWPHPSLLWEEEQLCDAGGSPRPVQSGGPPTASGTPQTGRGGELWWPKTALSTVLESCSSPISALGMGLSPKFPAAGAGSPDTKTNASTISLRISSRNMPPHVSSRIVEISVSNEGSRAVGCGLHMCALSGGCASCPNRTEGLTMRPHANAKLIMVNSRPSGQARRV